VVGILTGHLLKDPDYVYRYHSGELETPSGELVRSTFGNRPLTVANNRRKIIEALEATADQAPAGTGGR
jgi:threonine synthase